MADAIDFYTSLPLFDDFADVTQPETYTPLPDDWVVGFADVIASTAAIAAGRYKAVNMVGAGVIAAVANAIGRRPFPFVFGGDGASFAVSAADAPAATGGLAAMAAFAHREYQLRLRVAAIPVSDIRAAGHDVRVSRFSASGHCQYAMFSGGGLSWFEERAKLGENSLAPASADASPDLSGLSCRFGVAPAKHGLVVSLIITPGSDDPRFAALVHDIVLMAMDASQCARPISVDMLGVKAPGQAIALEAAAMKATWGVSRVRALVAVAASYVLGAKFMLGVAFPNLKVKLGGFEPALYAADVAANADFRKFDDGLRMTLDCSAAFADAIETRLAAAADYADWGMHRQKSAQITCFVPSITERGHVHFVDGAEGGYAMAATAMKARKAHKAYAAG